jgi:enediyne biosynthesis protein E4
MNDHEQRDEVPNDEVIGKALIASLVVFALLGSGGAFAWWWITRGEAPVAEPARPVVLPERRTLPQVSPPNVIWTDITREAGIDFQHENGAFGNKLLPETMGGGCAFFDYDGDGHPDLLFVNGRRWPDDPRPEEEPATLRLYRNDGTGRFTDVTAEAGLGISLYGMGVACGDYNGNGRIDLFISCLGRDRLFRNDGGTFTEVTDLAGVAGPEDAWSTSCGWFDYDGDGHLDLFVCRYLQWSAGYDLAQDFRLTGDVRAYGRPQDFGGTFVSLYRNDGNGRFVDVAEQAGLHVRNPATGVPMAKALGVIFDDFNGNGWLDVMVANDTVRNFLFLNQQDGTFAEVGTLAGIAYDNHGGVRGAMGIDSADFRNDGSLGVAIGNFSNEMTALYVSRKRNLQFYDEAVANGLGPATRLQLSFGLLFFDFDLNGRLDLFQANGHLEEDIRIVQESQRYEQSPQLFWNAGKEYETEFILCGEESTAGGTRDLQRPLVGRGAAYADIDGDGDLDLVITASGGPPRLLRNDQDLGHNWLRVRLEGEGGNRHGIGAFVVLETAAGRQTRLVSPTRSYLSQVELPVTFGLGTETEVESLTIRWPDGTVQPVKVEAVNRTVLVRKADG